MSLNYLRAGWLFTVFPYSSSFTDIVSILDIDWASLAKQPAPKQTTGSLLKRFHPASIFHEIGISRNFAGEALFNKVKTICEQGIDIDTQRKEGMELGYIDYDRTRN